jgi:caffeoyl-CoA O-methyltransferase
LAAAVAHVILNDDVARYLDGLVPAPDPLMAEIQAHGARDGIPIIVPDTAVLLGVLARACGARRVVEVGTAIGMSTLILARAVGPGGVVVSFEVDAVRQQAAAGYLERDGLTDRVDLRLQDAGRGLSELEGPFDMAFLDAFKSDYPRHLELVLPLTRPGGLIAIDNVLMDGTVATGVADRQWTGDAIAGMRELNADLMSRDDLAAWVLPVGDGVAVAVRR